MNIQDWDQDALEPLRLLVVDDDDAVRKLLVRQLALDGHFADCAADGLLALEKLAVSSYDVVITDQTMPGMRGEQLASEVKRCAPATGVLLLTGFHEIDFASRARRDVDVVLGKPLTRDQLRAALMQARHSVLSTSGIA